MANFSTKERMIASMLASMPGLKRILKQTYIRLNAILYSKPYKHRILADGVSDIRIFEPLAAGGETFFGYYDKTPVNPAYGVLFHESDDTPTFRKPGIDPIRICLKKTNGSRPEILAGTTSYNWQQGCRAQWLDDSHIIFNTFAGGSYGAVLYDIASRKISKHYSMPVQETFGLGGYLAINPRRIMALRPDYGYRNLPSMTHDELADTDNDGIWYVSLDDGQVDMLHTLTEIKDFEPAQYSAKALHKVNHIMTSPDGTRFIFIHRWYEGKRRFDRLMMSDNGQLRVLVSDGMVSHMCWVDNYTLFGYFRYYGADGFRYIEVNTGHITECEVANCLNQGDGHPSAWEDWIVIDSYPDKSRMQHLTLINRRSHQVVPLLEIYHGLKFSGETRCDLHPRFSTDGRTITFDTVFTGQRRMASVDVSAITQTTTTL